ncbi:MAG: hypothetical protein ACREO9_05990, partial [Lysobacterales bacterium]
MRQSHTISKAKGRRASPAGRRRWAGRAWRLFLLLAGGFLGLCIPWTAYLNYQVTTEFEGRKWDLPSRVYARPLELYPGLRISRQDLEQELKFAGYRAGVGAGAGASKPGHYQVRNSSVDMYLRSFRFPEG